jgi:hypothetical protein
MKHGHVTGLRRQRRNASHWYKTCEQEHIDRIEREWQARTAATAGETGTAIPAPPLVEPLPPER